MAPTNVKQYVTSELTRLYESALKSPSLYANPVAADNLLRRMAAAYRIVNDIVDPSEEAIIAIIKEDLAYRAAYYDDNTRALIEKTFSCEHPVFGSIELHGPPSQEEAFSAGAEFARLGKVDFLPRVKREKAAMKEAKTLTPDGKVKLKPRQPRD